MAASGEVQRTITRIAPFGDVDVEPISLFANGDVLGVPFQWRPARDQPLGVAVGNLNRDRVVLLMYSPEGAVVDSIGAWLGIQRFRGMVVPFARSVVYSSRQTTTAIGPTDSLDVSIYDRDTRLVRLLGSANNRPISSQDREHWRSAVLAADSNSGRQIVAATKEMPVPSELPDIGGLVVDAADNVWVGDYAAPQTTMRRWRFFSSRGQALATVELPVFGDPYLPGENGAAGCGPKPLGIGS